MGIGRLSIALAKSLLALLPFFDRDAWRAWSPMLYHVVETHVPDAVLARFSADVEDWIEWLQTETARATGRTPNLIDEVLAALRTDFAGIRVFHGTRLTSLQDVATRGFVAWDEQALVHLAREQFGRVADAAALENAMARTLPEARAGRVYTFSALSIALDVRDDEDPVGRVPCFSSHGGEWLRAVAANLGIDAVVEEPTVGYLFALDIPWAQCAGETQHIIAQHALTASLIAMRLDRRRYRMASGLDCVDIASDIPPTAIVAFTETDPLAGVIKADELRWTSWRP